MTKRSLWLLPLAAALILTGCSGSDNADPVTAESSPAPSQKQDQTSGASLSADQVKDVVTKLVGEDSTAQILDNEVMKPQLENAKAMEGSNGIKPEKCAKQQEEYTVTDLTGTVAASATVQGDSTGKVIQIFSITDAQTRKNISEALKLSDIEGCESISVSVSGQEVNTDRQILDLDSTADQALTMATQMKVGADEYLNSVAVQALEGNNFVLVTFSSGTVEAPLLAGEAMKLADQAFAEIKSLQ
ncbi:hypothetical protein CQ010_00755 [Arthrobacter sp. MYb211]|uniref:hypothetical protein n=1 Tax=Micrococcaceae TaxID=1268 RepID=UPI000CFCB52B|nr:MULTISPECIES: hypothetical protein [unclassified Arthrobacter]PQZ98087.1 hypothetical protein CQ017_10700 [Arthrobacter sp. MYb224]PRA02516.1 hypothetical protein CQ019_13740 [Arthrobacter sp. MYb229]PRA13210.1 hypothetical protein CQ015_03010 [Arthrobacter sp. MYb221]PRB50541.1 hypothetical protein CQ013_11085 [Arthrobacter sp. MYb216]PRC10404.1 hypothetical protein CQ010_00755 [Arthrobacter sp. MYb211]